MLRIPLLVGGTSQCGMHHIHKGVLGRDKCRCGRRPTDNRGRVDGHLAHLLNKMTNFGSGGNSNNSINMRASSRLGWFSRRMRGMRDNVI